jgi:hypothetical protein
MRMSQTKPTSFFSLGRIAGAAVRFACAPLGWYGKGRGAPDFQPTLPGGRSVPMPLVALTRLLDHHPTARSRMKHLALIETSCQLSPEDPFRQLPPRTLEIAIRQLEPVLEFHEGLHVLRLQLERQLQTHRARVDAALLHEKRQWRPDAGASRFGPIEFDNTGHLAFAETMPLGPAATH